MTDPAVSASVAGLSFMLGLPPTIRHPSTAAFVAVSSVETVEAQVRLLSEGDRESDKGVILLSGEVMVEKTDTPRSTVSAPALFGEMVQFSTKSERWADVTTTQKSEVLLFSWARFYAHLHEHLSDDLCEEFRQALRQYSWMHFLGDDV